MQNDFRKTDLKVSAFWVCNKNIWKVKLLLHIKTHLTSRNKKWSKRVVCARINGKFINLDVIVSLFQYHVIISISKVCNMGTKMHPKMYEFWLRRPFYKDGSKFASVSNEFAQGTAINLIGFCPLNTASGRTNRRSFPATFQDVTQPPNKYSSASLHIISQQIVH